jgi:hypothetical protein
MAGNLKLNLNSGSQVKEYVRCYAGKIKAFLYLKNHSMESGVGSGYKVALQVKFMGITAVSAAADHFSWEPNCVYYYEQFSLRTQNKLKPLWDNSYNPRH